MIGIADLVSSLASHALAADPVYCPYCREPMTPQPSIAGRRSSDVVSDGSLGRDPNGVTVNPSERLQAKPGDCLAWQCFTCQQIFFTRANPYTDPLPPGLGD